MALFGPPNIEKLTEKNNVKGLVKALGYKKDADIPLHAIQALAWVGDERAHAALAAIADDTNQPEALRTAARSAAESSRFIAGALQNQSLLRCQIHLKDIHHVYYAIALHYRRNFNNDSRRAIAFVESNLSGACPTCGQLVTGNTLSTVGTMQDDGANMMFMGGMSETAALTAGKCANPECFATEIDLIWR